MTVSFSRDYLRDDLHLPYENFIVDTIVGTTRWAIVHEIIFEDKGKFYQTRYLEGATELQDEIPWEHDNLIECTEVELREVKVKKWMPV